MTDAHVTRSGKVLADQDLEQLADEAERGYELMPTSFRLSRRTLPNRARYLLDKLNPALEASGNLPSPIAAWIVATGLLLEEIAQIEEEGKREERVPGR